MVLTRLVWLLGLDRVPEVRCLRNKLAALTANQAPDLHLFVIVFDREGYRPAFFKEMWHTHRIACTTYHKYPKDPWPETEFRHTEITLANGERMSMKLAERGSWIGSRRDGLWVREVRKLTESGHQTSLISTTY